MEFAELDKNDGCLRNFLERKVSLIRMLTVFCLTDLTKAWYLLPPLTSFSIKCATSSGSAPKYLSCVSVTEMLLLFGDSLTSSPGDNVKSLCGSASLIKFTHCTVPGSAINRLGETVVTRPVAGICPVFLKDEIFLRFFWAISLYGSSSVTLW